MNASMQKAKHNTPISLVVLSLFTTAISFFNLPLSFAPLTIALVGCAFYHLKNSYLSNKPLKKPYLRVIAYLLLFVGLYLIWQQLEIPSLVAISALLTLLTWAKFCELKSTRDQKFIWFLLSILLAINIILTPQFQLPIAFVGIILLLLTASYFSVKGSQNSDPNGNQDGNQKKQNKNTLKAIVSQLSLLTLVSLPFAIVLFLTLPRINLPMQELGLAMGLPITVEVDKSLADKGLGQELNFNDIGEQGRSDSRVMLVGLPSDFTQNPQQPLYWRGPVYWRYIVEKKTVQGTEQTIEKWQLRKDFDVRTKRQYNGFGSNKSLAQMTSNRENTIEYSVILMPHGEYWLYALDLPLNLTGESYLSQDYQLLSIRKVSNMWRYKIKSSLQYQISAKEPQAQRQLGLQYPEANPQIKALGEQWQQQFSGEQFPAQAIIAHAKSYFTQEKYLYANDDHKYLGENHLDQFFFNRKIGYSQQYASALTLLLRAANVPARLVAGYCGAEQVDLTNMYTVSDHHAHAWVEAYISTSDSQGHWQRIDPALWLSDLFSNGSSSDSSNNEKEQEQLANKQQKNNSITKANVNQNTKQNGKQTTKQNQTSWLDNVKQWTLTFDGEKQTQLAKKLGIKNLLWWHLLAIAVGLLALLASVYYFSLRFINRHKKPPEHLIIYHKLCKKLAKKGLTRLPHEGAQSYLSRCISYEYERARSESTNNKISDKNSDKRNDKANATAKHIAKLQQLYLQLAYSKQSDTEKTENLKQFKHLVAKI
ncbi:MAG: DUF3488 domain-containing protein [Colwellia sp.]|nr:DUF3488 domain-containing protein [Colwellia sp.]